MSSSVNVQKAEYLLKSMLFDPSKAAQLGVHHWASESDRWNELVTILLSHRLDLPPDEVRTLTRYLSDLGHLDVQQLARIALNGDGVDRSDDEAAKILDIFARKAVPEDQAEGVLLLLCQIARGLTSHFDGKIQRYLRSYGEAMLSDIPRYFPMLRARPDEVEHIFTLWLQEVLNMPVALRDPILGQFCQRHGLDEDELIEAADNINLNVSIVDEMLRLE